MGRVLKNGAQQEKRCQNAVDRRGFVTVAMMKVKHSVVHRPKIGESVTPNTERKEPSHLDPPDLSIALRTEGTAVQLCGNSNVGDKWISGHYVM